jgi:arylsulfatase A-like enzyme
MLKEGVVHAPVTNMQVAPTILKALGLNPNKLVAVQREHTEVLPGLEGLSDED